jgi:hypothetical protein
MSWLYSRALVGAYSAANCSDGEPSAPLNGSPTPRAYLPPDRMTAFSRLSRFGMTFAPLTDDRGEALLKWFLEASRARTSASQAKAPASTASDQECGPTWRELWAKYDPATCSWRTLQPSLLADSDELSPTWPRSGMTADGLCWALPMLGRRTSETDSGLWPTPSGTSNHGKNHVAGRLDEWGGSSNPLRGSEIAGVRCASFEEWMMGWTTGWTALTPYETDRSPSAPQPLGECLQEA